MWLPKFLFYQKQKHNECKIIIDAFTSDICLKHRCIDVCVKETFPLVNEKLGNPPELAVVAHDNEGIHGINKSQRVAVKQTTQ